MYKFKGKWITTEEFAALKPRWVFSRQLERKNLDCSEHRNRHILFRKRFELSGVPTEAKIYISADDHYKLYINGRYVTEGPAPAYHFRYNYNEIDVTEYLTEGENLIAVHTLYQGLINRVWQSGDNRHGLILDLVADGECVLASGEDFLTAYHTGYRETGTSGYETAFLEEYDSRAAEVGFEQLGYDDGGWCAAALSEVCDHTLVPQATAQLTEERIYPVSTEVSGNSVRYDFGGCHVGYLYVKAKGASGERVTVRAAQELNEDGSVRYELRANCRYEESWILSEGECELIQYDYKSFRYAELVLPKNTEITEVYLVARHYPFECRTELKPGYAGDSRLRAIWDLCVRTQRYGVQEALLDCMEREKGFYLGDGCYTALTHMVLTGDEAMVRKLIDEAFASDFITDGLVTCINCSFMQEIAEYPLMLVRLILWHYRLTGDAEYLKKNYEKTLKLLESYRREYEKGGLLRDLDKWCVVEWPMNFRDGYDVDITEGQVCHEAHVSINAYYIAAIMAANEMAEALGLPEYRDSAALAKVFKETFYLEDKKLFCDGENTDHVSLIGNIFPFALELCPEAECRDNIIKMISERGISSTSLFCAFLVLEGLYRCGREDMIRDMLLDEGAWLRMLREDATTTFEGWGKDTKWNTSLFHMTMSYAALFMADVDLGKIFK